MNQNLVWRILQRQRCPCIIVATNSLEECKALCTRMCVLVQGRVEALGSVRRLQSRCVARVAVLSVLTCALWL